MSRYCFNCLHHMEPGTTRCSKCGFDCAAYQEPKTAIHPETILAGRYIVGKTIEKTGTTLGYVAKDCQANKKVIIREYFPDRIAVRQADGTLAIHSHNDKQNFIDGMNAFSKEIKMMQGFNDQPGHRSVTDCFNANNTSYYVLTYMKNQAADTPVKIQNPEPEANDMSYYDSVSNPEPELTQTDNFNQVSTPAQSDQHPKPVVKWKKIIFIILAVVLAAAIAAGVYFFAIRKSSMTIEEFKAKAAEKGYTVKENTSGTRENYPKVQDSVYMVKDDVIIEFAVCDSEEDAREVYAAFKKDNDTLLYKSGISDPTEETCSGSNYDAVIISCNDEGDQIYEYIGRLGNTLLLFAVESDDAVMRDFVDDCGYPLP